MQHLTIEEESIVGENTLKAPNLGATVFADASVTLRYKDRQGRYWEALCEPVQVPVRLAAPTT